MLQIEGLTKYFGGLIAVSDFDLRIKRGDIFGLIGPNGAGKTTVFNLITGFLKPTNGKVELEGKDITGQKPHTIAAHGIIRTFQATDLFNNFSVLNNIIAASYLKTKAGLWKSMFHTSRYRKRETSIVKRAMEIVQFVGLERVKDSQAGSLPHGHKRILGIAISLAANPKLLLLDEPLGGMNAREVAETVELIERVWQRGTTILLIEHNMRAAMSLCKRIVVLNFGRKIAEGSPEEIRENKEVIQAYLGSGKHVT